MNVILLNGKIVLEVENVKSISFHT